MKPLCHAVERGLLLWTLWQDQLHTGARTQAGAWISWVLHFLRVWYQDGISPELSVLPRFFLVSLKSAMIKGCREPPYPSILTDATMEKLALAKFVAQESKCEVRWE